MEPLRIFCDGSCPKNGAADATASCGIVIIYKNEIIKGIYKVVEPRKYMIDAGTLVTYDKEVPTNNRAELLALYYAIVIANHAAICGNPVTIYSDSSYAIQTTTKWYPNRLAKGIAGELENVDLLECIHHVRSDKYDIIHCRGHVVSRKGDGYNKLELISDPISRLIAIGNAEADAVASGEDFCVKSIERLLL